MQRTSADGRRWVGVGTARVDDVAEPADVGVTAGRAALGDRARDARLLVLFAGDGHDLAALVAGVRSLVEDVPVVGCSTAGELSSHGIDDDSVVVTALGGPGFRVDTALVPIEDGDLRTAGAAAAEVAAPPDAVDGHPHRVLLLLTDGLAGDQQEIVRGAYATLGATVPIVGGCAGDGLRMVGTRQLHGRRAADDTVTSGAVVAAAISSDAPIGIGIGHGWDPVGEPLLVTESHGNLVRRLDDRPALDVYLERLDAPAEAWTDPDAFRRFAIVHPLGLERRSGVEVRFIGDARPDAGAIVGIAGVPQGELAYPLTGDASTVLDATEVACGDASGQLEGRAPIGALAFDCIGRRGVLDGAGLDGEHDRIRTCIGGAPFGGFYTYGEFARVSGPRGFHNQTLVLLAFA